MVNPDLFARGVLIGILFSSHLHAAPLDPLMSSRHTKEPWHGELELSLDHMNNTLDFLSIRESHDEFSGTSVGDYSGGHLAGGLALNEVLWVDGSLWDRVLDYRSEEFKLTSWHLSTQLRMNELTGVVIPDWAVRATLWGNHAKKLTKGTPTSLYGITAEQVDIHQPTDLQWQLDLIGAWDMGDRSEMTLFVGGGGSKTEFDKLTVEVDFDRAANVQAILNQREQSIVVETVADLVGAELGGILLDDGTTLTVNACESGVCEIGVSLEQIEQETVQTLLNHRSHPLIQEPIDALFSDNPLLSTISPTQEVTVTQCQDGVCDLSLFLEEEGATATVSGVTIPSSMSGDIPVGAAIEQRFDGTVFEISANEESGKISVAGYDLLDNPFGNDNSLGISHNTSYFHAGAGWLWFNERWRLRAGYKMSYINWGGYEETVRQYNPAVSTEQINNIVVADATYRLTKQTALFVRGQAMTNQFLGEIPFSYTPYTAHRFDEKYGFVSAGINYFF